MHSKELLLNRQSQPKLSGDSPSDEVISFILQCGMRVPDHGALSPWHFTVIKGDGLEKLNNIFSSAAKNANFDEVKIAKAGKMASRAPLIIAVSTKYQTHEKVPASEQAITAGCCVHAMQMAAYSLGLGAMWRTGDFSYNVEVKTALSVEQKDDIVGFLYIGSIDKCLPKKPAKDLSGFVSYL